MPQAIGFDQLETTRYLVENDDYKYQFNMHPSKGTWTVIRWNAKHPQIPTGTDVLTKDGWGSCMTNKPTTFTNIDYAVRAVNRLSTNQTGG